MEPVSISEFQSAIGEMRRRTDERHLENITRLTALEVEFRAHAKEDLLAIARIDVSIERNTQLTRNTLNAANETQKAVQGWIDMAATAKQGKRFLVTLASVSVALAAIYGVAMYFLGRGPIPGIHL